MKNWKLIDKLSREEVALPAKRTTFRDEKVVIIDARPPTHEGSSGRIYTAQNEWYPSVVGLKFIQI